MIEVCEVFLFCRLYHLNQLVVNKLSFGMSHEWRIQKFIDVSLIGQSGQTISRQTYLMDLVVFCVYKPCMHFLEPQAARSKVAASVALDGVHCGELLVVEV